MAAKAGNGHLLRIRGVRGFLQGEELLLKRGDEVVVGRSRHCDLSVRRSTRYLERADRNSVSESEAWRSVSRAHARIAFHRPDHIVIEDLSANGSFLDGRRIEGKVNIADIESSPHVLTLGAVERLKLELA